MRFDGCHTCKNVNKTLPGAAMVVNIKTEGVRSSYIGGFDVVVRAAKGALFRFFNKIWQMQKRVARSNIAVKFLYHNKNFLVMSAFILFVIGACLPLVGSYGAAPKSC